MSSLSPRERVTSYSLGTLGTACKEYPEQMEAFFTECFGAKGSDSMVQSAQAIIDVLSRALMNVER